MNCSILTVHGVREEGREGLIQFEGLLASWLTVQLVSRRSGKSH